MHHQPGTLHLTPEARDPEPETRSKSIPSGTGELVGALVLDPTPETRNLKPPSPTTGESIGALVERARLREAEYLHRINTSPSLPELESALKKMGEVALGSRIPIWVQDFSPV